MQGGFSFTISLGDLLSTIAMIGALLTVYVNLRDRITVLEIKVGPLWNGYTDRRKIAPPED